MPVLYGPRGNNAFPEISFHDLAAGATTPLFTLPGGFGEIQYSAVDQNNPGIVTLQDASGNTILTLNTSVVAGGLPVFTGSLYFEVDPLGKTYKINTSQAAQCIQIFFEQPLQT